MLVRLVRTYLAPYKRELAGVLVLQLVGTIASLYLPSLNAEIIDEGVAKGDTGYILRTGGWMLGVSSCRSSPPSPPPTSPPAPRWRWAATCGRRLRPGRRLLRAGGLAVRRADADLPQHQRRDPGADGRLHGAAMMVSAPIMMVGGIIMALREDVRAVWLVAVAVPLLASLVGLVIRRMIPQFRLMQTSVDWVNRVLREQITGIRVVRAFVREDHERERFAEANRP